MTKNWTPEPWRVVHELEDAFPCIKAGRKHVCSMVDEEDAARIVACVNAMAGIDDPQGFVERANEFAIECAELQTANRELVEALETMVVCYANSGGCVRNEDGYCTEHTSLCPINRALAALERAKGESKQFNCTNCNDTGVVSSCSTDDGTACECVNKQARKDAKDSDTYERMSDELMTERDTRVDELEAIFDALDMEEYDRTWSNLNHPPKRAIEYIEAMEQSNRELVEEAKKWEDLHDAMADALMFEVKRDTYGPTETDPECIKRIIRERNELVEALEELIQNCKPSPEESCLTKRPSLLMLRHAATVLKRAKGE